MSAIKPQTAIVNYGNPLTNGLVAVYPFLEKGGTVLHDGVVINNGTLSNITYQNDLPGNVLKFNGTTSSIRTTSIWKADNKNITITAIAKTTDITSTRQSLFINGRGVQDNPGTPPYDKGFALVLSGNSTTDGSIYILDENVAWINCSFKVTDNNWHHYALVLNSSGFPIVYLDGLQKYNPGSGSVTTPSVTSGTLTSNIGSDDAGSFTGFWKGSIADVKVYNRALTPNEIWSLFVNPWQIYSMPSAYKNPVTSMFPAGFTGQAAKTISQPLSFDSAISV